MKRGGGERGDGSGHPKSEITKIKMQQLDDFFNCEATNTYILLRASSSFFSGTAKISRNRGSRALLLPYQSKRFFCDSVCTP